MNKESAEKLIKDHAYACMDFKQYHGGWDWRVKMDAAAKAILTALLGQSGEAKPDPIREAAIAYVRSMRSEMVSTVEKLKALVDAVDNQDQERKQ